MKRSSIIVCTIGRSTLEECLKSLLNQSYENYEVIVVSSNKKVEPIVSQFQFTFIYSHISNVSYQKNLGIDNSSGEIIAFIDDDAVANKEWLKYLVENFKEEKIGCVGGKISVKINSDIPPILKNLPTEIFKGFLGETLLKYDKVTEIDKPLLWGSNISFRRDVLREVGKFDVQLGRTPTNLLCGEEIELERRILKAGYKLIYEPRAEVIHLINKERLTKSYFLRRSFWQGYSEILTTRKSFLGMKDENVSLLIKNLIPLHKIENISRMLVASNLKKSIDLAREIGRLEALKDLLSGKYERAK